ncbi:MAG: CHASE domain-containing protein [Mariprofundaceae bacterium]|nr:CHASE domain-containing protein [Mariprofundaceae bacterium]
MMEKKGHQVKSFSHIIVACVLISGLLITVFSAHEAQMYSEKMMMKAVDSLADRYVSLIHANIIRTSEELESTGAFMNDDMEEHGSDVIGGLEDFQHFTRHLMVSNPSVRTMEWIPSVLHDRRQWYEKNMKIGSFKHGFHFIEKNKEGQMVTAYERAQYFPVYYIEPMLKNMQNHGFDLGSNNLYYQVIKNSINSGLPAVSQVLSEASAKGKVILYFNPVYDEQHEIILLGFALAVVDVTVLIESSLKEVSKQDLGFNIYDQEDSRNLSNLTVKVYDQVESKATLLYEQGTQPRSDTFLSYKMIHAEDRVWPAVFWPTEDFLKQHESWLYESILFFGVLLSLLLSMYLHLLQSRNMNIQLQVEEQTVALTQSSQALLENINQRIFAEQEIRELNADLEDRVQKRTVALAASNQELEAFCYSVSHDLRAPLRSISGFSQILLEDYLSSLDEDGQDYLQRVDHAAKQMGALIDDLLRLSRINRDEIVYTQVDLTELTYRKLELLSEMQRDRQIEFNIQEGMIVSGDKNLLKLLIQNLLENAMKYTSKEEHACIEFSSKDIEGEQVFYVRDNGVGFDMAYVDKLFQPFQRLHSVKDFPGSGVGLATVQRVIQRHSGRIWADSSVNAGTVFYFVLND